MYNVAHFVFNVMSVVAQHHTHFTVIEYSFCHVWWEFQTHEYLFFVENFII